MEDAPSMIVAYASGTTRRTTRWRRRWLIAPAATGVYVGAYLVLRAFVEPAANMAFFVYPGSETMNECCYYGFWPLYKTDRFLTGRAHNLDRAPLVTPDGGFGP